MNELMNGVQVLSEKTVNTGDFLGLSILCLLASVFCLIMFIVSIIWNEPSGSLFITGTLVLGIFGAVLISANNTQEYTEYKVTINDNITYKEFTDKFEVISQEGKIYTVKLRESEE